MILANFGYSALAMETAEISVIRNNEIVGAQHIYVNGFAQGFFLKGGANSPKSNADMYDDVERHNTTVNTPYMSTRLYTGENKSIKILKLIKLISKQ